MASGEQQDAHAEEDVVLADGAVSAQPPANPEKARRLAELMQKMAALNAMGGSAEPRQLKQPKDMDQYKFWKTQPVPGIDEVVTEDGPIQKDIAVSEIRAEPYPLPKDFEWDTLDVTNDDELKTIYELLSNNYVEDESATIRFDYKAEFLRWALMSPGWLADWHVGVRVKSNRKLVGFISATPCNLSIRDRPVRLVSIDFLCVHKKLRSKRLAPVLIKEITRRVNLKGIFQAVYTAGAYLPKPVTTCRYFHRSLNPKKLVETGFSAIGRNMTMSRLIRLLKVPEEPLLSGFRQMTKNDVPAVTKLLKQYFGKMHIHPDFNKDEVAHYFLPIDSVVYSFVVEENNKITDFVSFYSLPSSVLDNPKHTHIYAAYLYYYVPRGLGDDPDRLRALIKDALIVAHKQGFDVFNCLNLMQNEHFLSDLKFGKGDGSLHYYFYNYRCRSIEMGEMGLVLL